MKVHTCTRYSPPAHTCTHSHLTRIQACMYTGTDEDTDTDTERDTDTYLIEAFKVKETAGGGNENASRGASVGKWQALTRFLKKAARTSGRLPNGPGFRIPAPSCSPSHSCRTIHTQSMGIARRDRWWIGRDASVACNSLRQCCIRPPVVLHHVCVNT